MGGGRGCALVGDAELVWASGLEGCEASGSAGGRQDGVFWWKGHERQKEGH